MSKSKKRDDRQLSFFDDPAPAPVEPEWQEVPQAVYFSWSDARQIEYSARRDEDAAKHAEGAMKEFFTERARCYRELLK